MEPEVTVPEGNAASEVGLEGAAFEQLPEGAEQQVADTPQTVSIDGTEYTLDELRSSNMRQADYTRKTQELAAERQENARAIAVWGALQEDPVGALEALQEHYAEQLAATEPVDPDEQRLRRVESFITTQEERDAIAQVDSQLSALEQKYGQFDHNVVLEHAITSGIGNLRAAYLDYRESNPQMQAQQQRAAADAAALAAKQNLPLVAGAGSAAGSQKVGGKPIVKARDALAEALAEFGMDSISSAI